jgi:hypothetical protein
MFNTSSLNPTGGISFVSNIPQYGVSITIGCLPKLVLLALLDVRKRGGLTKAKYQIFF